ncbi:extracellular solute-binding protein [Devosia sp.]|uniref:ABC transporter substrate-binding protein n=1 Tax=Devosia sp. TaxID=1871048 RepID=UPI0032675F89
MTDKKLTRRAMLQGTAAAGAGLFAAGSGFPAFGQDAPKPDAPLPVSASGKLTVIHRTEYFEEAQTIFRSAVTDFAAANKVELDISTTNSESFGDFLGKMTAAVKAGNPPDFAYTSTVSIAQMNALDIAEDVTDVVEEAIKRYGNVMPGINAEINGKFDGKWKSIPYLGSTTSFMFRKDKLAEKNIDASTLLTLDQRREAALAISGPDLYGWGLTPNQSGDGYGFLNSVVLAFGGHYSDETGQIVQFNTPETVAAYEWLVETYDRNGKYAAMLPPGVESWNDTGNNEAWLAGSIGYTLNSFSVYARAKKEKNPVFPNITLVHAPTGNNGDSRDGGFVGGWLTIFKNAPNKDLAKQLALEMIDPKNFTAISSIAGGLFMPAYEGLWTPELLAADPNYGIIKEQVSVTNPFLGETWPAKPAPQFGAIRASGLLEQSVGNAISKRMTAAEAVADAHQKIVELFEEGGIMQP